MLLLLPVLSACNPAPTDDDTAPREVPWSAEGIRLGEGPRGWRWARSIIHLHSPWSHDACDGAGLIDEAPDPECLAELREGLCRAGIDLAFGTDHPSYAAWADFDDWLLADQEADQVVEGIAGQLDCGDGGSVLWMPGLEDELMPVGLESHVGADPDDRDALYNRDDAEALAALRGAGAEVLIAHTEQRDPTQLAEQQAAGLAGLEHFNLHAMFDPDIREASLGLDGWAWLQDVGPFLDEGGDAEVDLAFLAVYQAQDVSLERWDALSQNQTTFGFGGTDAHQNVLPSAARDGERFDSYRRMTRWFSNWLLVDALSPAAGKGAVAAARGFTVFEILGAPDGLDVWLEVGGDAVEVGGDAASGTLHVGCAALHPESPRGPADPEITARVIKDGDDWATGCGAHDLNEAGVYRVVYDITPWHLEPFMADQADALMKTYPWIYSNAFRIGLD